MRIPIAILLSLFGANVLAAPTPDQVEAIVEDQPGRDNFVKHEEANVYIGFGPYRLALAEPRQPLPSIVRIVPVDGGSRALDAITSSQNFLS